MKMEDIKTSVHDVRININKIRHSQYMLGAQMSKVQMIESTNEDLNMIKNHCRTLIRLMEILRGLTFGRLSIC